MTPQEAEAWERRASRLGVTVSEALRAPRHEVKVYRITRNADVEALAAEARKIGCTINQLARAANGARLDVRDWMQVRASLDAAAAALDRLADQAEAMGREVET